MQNSSNPIGWHHRGYLPHFDGGEICQFITLHLGDALPREIVERWKKELENQTNEQAKREIFKRSANYPDKSYGECYLKTEPVAEQVRESLLYFNAVRYKLISWVIMPNHTHFLIKPLNDFALSDIMKSFKSFTAHQANKILSRNGRFWQEDYFDRYIRDREHFEKTIDYIESNPVKAGLCEKRSDWKYSSAYQRSADGSSANER